MKTFKHLPFVLLAVMIIAIAGVITVVAMGNEQAVPADYSENWTTQSGRFAEKTGLLLVNEDGTVKEDGFTYSTDELGGIKVTAASAEEAEGVTATSIVSSKAKTALDGLTVKIMPEQLVATVDENGRSPVFSVLWTADEIGSLSETGHFDHVATNGLRNIAKPTKGLCVTLNNTYRLYNNTRTFSNVMITYIDGDFTDICDHRLGYRWSFTARNNYKQSPDCDKTGIVSSYEEIDVTDGLTVNVRADEEHGYIVSVNGADYYKSEDIAYYPNNVKDQYAGDSYTSLKEDIDLSGLEGLEGYVTVGMTGSMDKTSGYAYTINEINGVPAAQFAAAE